MTWVWGDGLELELHVGYRASSLVRNYSEHGAAVDMAWKRGIVAGCSA